MHAEKRKRGIRIEQCGGGLSTGQPIVARGGVTPPTIDNKRNAIDTYTNENKDPAAITRRDATIVARIWPVAENYTAMVLLDTLFAYYGYQHFKTMVETAKDS